MDRLHRSAPTCALREINVVCWAVCIAFLILPQFLAIKQNLQTGGFRRADASFVYFYSMGRLFDEYEADQVYNYELQKKVCMQVHPLKAGGYGPIPYPPYLGVLFRPFGRMSFLSAYLLWLSISFTLYVAGLFVITGHIFPREPLRRSLIFCFALAFWPFIWFLTTGQISMLGFFAMALAFRQEDRERPVLSGLALSLCLYKPTLLLLILPMLLLTKRYKTLLGLAAGGTAVVAMATIVEGPGVWPGYLHTVLSFGSAAATRTQQNFEIFSTSYVDLVSFFTVLPGGHSWPARILLMGCAGWAGWSLLRAWRSSVGAPEPAQTLVWAATLTWTLVLNVYVPIYDTVLVVLSIVATAGVLRNFPDRDLYRRFTILWVLILAGSWITVPIAKVTGFQIITVLFALLGMLQIAALRRLATPTVSSPAESFDSNTSELCPTAL
jgi:hypothetical protein